MSRAPLPATLGDTSDGLLRNLSLLFVPAGVVQHLSRLGIDGLRLLAVVVLGTVTLLVPPLLPWLLK